MVHSQGTDYFDRKNERIEEYKEKFDFYCTAHDIAGERQKVLFLT